MTECDEQIQSQATVDGNISWRLAYRSHLGKADQSLSLLTGKRLIKPLPKSQSGFEDLPRKRRKDV